MRILHQWYLKNKYRKGVPEIHETYIKITRVWVPYRYFMRWLVGTMTRWLIWHLLEIETRQWFEDRPIQSEGFQLPAIGPLKSRMICFDFRQIRSAFSGRQQEEHENLKC